jgi:Raf kinase inhibitor-like YbhB/YbcL family protein
MYRIALMLLVTVGMVLGACQAQDEPATEEMTADTAVAMMGDSAMAITITSTAFDEGGMIPKRFTCDDADVSPALSWTGVPDTAKSLVLICDDPDAPRKTWVHWVIYNMPPGVDSLSEAVPKDTVLANGGVQGTTDFGRIGYGGPCPPGGTHRYYFKLYALDTMLELSGKVTKLTVVEAMEGHVLAEGVLMGRYARQR